MTLKKVSKILTSNNYVVNKCFVGQTGTGKTTQILKELESEKINEIIYLYTGKTQVIKDGKKVFSMINIYEFLNVIQEYEPKNKIFVFDDMKEYISVNPNETNTKKINAFLGRSRHKNNIFYFSFWSFGQIPSFLFTYFHEIFVYHTKNKKNLDIPDIDILQHVIDRVNKTNDIHFFEKIEV